MKYRIVVSGFITGIPGKRFNGGRGTAHIYETSDPKEIDVLEKCKYATCLTTREDMLVELKARLDKLEWVELQKFAGSLYKVGMNREELTQKIMEKAA